MFRRLSQIIFNFVSLCILLFVCNALCWLCLIYPPKNTNICMHTHVLNLELFFSPVSFVSCLLVFLHVKSLLYPLPMTATEMVLLCASSRINYIPNSISLKINRGMIQKTLWPIKPIYCLMVFKHTKRPPYGIG